MGAFETFADLTEKDTKQDLDSTVARKLADIAGKAAAQRNAMGQASVDALVGKLEGCRATASPKHDMAVALCREPQS